MSIPAQMDEWPAFGFERTHYLAERSWPLCQLLAFAGFLVFHLSICSSVYLFIPSSVKLSLQYAGTDTGARAVAKHNAHVRLATLRYAMLEHLKRPPPFFERAVMAHFYYKRDEVRPTSHARPQLLCTASCTRLRRSLVPAVVSPSR